MAFSEAVKQAALSRANFRCECNRTDVITPAIRAAVQHRLSPDVGTLITAPPISVGGSDGLSNCQALCIPCHENTPSYGRS